MSLIKTAVDVVIGAVTTGAVYLPLDKQTERENICRGCDLLIPESLRCDRAKGGCGCRMPVKWKFVAAKCPKGKW